LLPVCKKLKIPLVLDWHHDRLNPSSEPVESYLPEINAIWAERGIKPKQHYSESAKGHPNPRTHSDYISKLPPCAPDMDLMIEAKMKDQTVLRICKKYNIAPDTAVYPTTQPMALEDDEEMEHQNVTLVGQARKKHTWKKVAKKEQKKTTNSDDVNIETTTKTTRKRKVTTTNDDNGDEQDEDYQNKTTKTKKLKTAKSKKPTKTTTKPKKVTKITESKISTKITESKKSTKNATANAKVVKSEDSKKKAKKEKLSAVVAVVTKVERKSRKSADVKNPNKGQKAEGVVVRRSARLSGATQ